MPHSANQSTQRGRRAILKAAAAAGVPGALGFPAIVRAQAQPIKIGVPTILSGRVAQLGISSRNAAQMEADAFNAAGGLNGRKIELIVRDSQGKPELAAKVTRDMINGDKVDFILDCEASSGAFAIHEVARELGTLTVHVCSETSSLTADPKLQIKNAFRVARQAAHDAIAAGSYAAAVAKERGLTNWMTIGPDYAYGRDTTDLFLKYLKHFHSGINVGAQLWPKLFQPDYTEFVTKIVQAKPQAIFTCLWGGDLVSFIDQGNLYGLFQNTQVFAIGLADYTTMTAVKNLPAGIHSGNRYVSVFPNTKENADWAAAYAKRFNDQPTNWSWEAQVGMAALIEGMRKTNGTDGRKMADAMRGMTMKSPFGANGNVTLRASDQTLVDYATGWGVTVPKAPFLTNIKQTDWGLITDLENKWKKEMGYV